MNRESISMEKEQVVTDPRSQVPDPGFSDPRSQVPDPSCTASTNPRSLVPDSEIAISVQNLTKVYKLYDTPFDRLKESINPFGKKYHKDFYALNDVSFEIKKGETVGIIGKNGSGKSTLLKIITGVLTPTSGNVTVNGKVSALLELGAGFNSELTGIENVYFNGTLMGYTREEMHERLDDILSFADIGEFVYQPVKTYSSGMFVRLAFAVAVNVEPDILIIDEALAVGDLRFQKKCKMKMDGFKESGKTMVLVSHSLADIRAMCSTVVYLQQGNQLYCGTAFDAIIIYTENENKLEADDMKKRSTDFDKMPNDNKSDIGGTGDIILRNMRCYQKGNNSDISEIEFGKIIVVEFDYESFIAISKPVITINIGCPYYKTISNINSINHGISIKELSGKGIIRVEITNPQFYPGTYDVHVGLTTENINVHYYRQSNAASFRIIAPQDRLLCYPAALVQPDANFSIEVSDV